MASKKDSFNSKVLALITKNSSQYISTMLVGNNLANVIYTIFLAKLLAAPLAPLNNELLILLLQTVIATVIVLFFAEFLPKTLFRILSDSALSTFAVPVAFFYLLFYPIVVISVLFARLIARIFGIRIDDHQKDNMFSRVDIEDIIVIYDDLDLETGKLRLRGKGSAGGHNGIKSLIQHLGTQEFNRIRVGVSRPPVGMKVADYVLSKFSKDDQPIVQDATKKSCEAVETALEKPFLEVMNQFNGA